MSISGSPTKVSGFGAPGFGAPFSPAAAAGESLDPSSGGASPFLVISFSAPSSSFCCC